MTDISVFLAARFAEDEAVARKAIGTAAFQRQTAHWSFEHVTGQYGAIPLVFAVADGGGKTQVARLDTAWDSEDRGRHIARWDPARVLAECDAKRRIVEMHLRGSGYNQALTDALRLLALPYSDHPDFRKEWAL